MYDRLSYCFKQHVVLSGRCENSKQNKVAFVHVNFTKVLKEVNKVNLRPGMWKPTLTQFFSVLFLAFMANNMWSIASLYLPPNCNSESLKAAKAICLKSALHHGPDRQIETGARLFLFSTESRKPGLEKDLTFLTAFDVPDLSKDEGQTEKVSIALPASVTKKNGTIFLAVFTTPIDSKADVKDAKSKWRKMIQHKDATFSMVALTQHHIPEAKTFQLLNEDEEKQSEQKQKQQQQDDRRVPAVHLRSQIKFSFMVDDIDLPSHQVPNELMGFVRFAASDNKKYLPITFLDELSLRLRDLVIVNATDTSATFDFVYEPISFGKLRLFVQFSSALYSLHDLGFTAKDTDEVKGIFADTNLVLLMVTFAVSAVHLLFDFLAFKNDISFWSNRTSMEGLSTRTLLWRAFSQSIIFLYLLDEETSLLVLIPSGVAAIIEMWKVTKAFKVEIGYDASSMIPWRPKFGTRCSSKAEEATEEYDSLAMKYLSYILYPLCIGGAGYSLLYTPHKSWWSWTISSLVNGVYAFGFLFMLPQLFVNYRLKSVAHLPWRAFMYKAFNTFIDDLFAFIITMPTAHRVACFRDDIVFLIYLYQRYLYPVDKSRIDVSGMIEETTDAIKVPTKNGGADAAVHRVQAGPVTRSSRRRIKAKAE